MKKKFNISLIENGFHSLTRGLSSFKSYEDSKDEFELKESIMFLHHGIELLFKQYLIEKASESLIYSKIDKSVTQKLIDAKKKGVKVFDLPNPPNTATYLEVINRSMAFTDNQFLTEQLSSWLTELNKIRNNIEHYAIDVSLESIEKLIQNLRQPIINLFQDSIKDFDSQQLGKTWKEVDSRISEYNKRELEIIELLKQMSDKAIPGGIFTNLLGGQLQMPKFQEILHNYRIDFEGNLFEADIYGKGVKDKDWLVEVKTMSPNKRVVDRLAVISQITGAKPWLIVFNKIPKTIKDYANQKEIYFTDEAMLQNLINVLKVLNK